MSGPAGEAASAIQQASVVSASSWGARLHDEGGSRQFAHVPQAKLLIIAAGAEHVLIKWAALDTADAGPMRLPVVRQ